MTAFICVPKQDRIDLLSDGACYSPDGIVRVIARKVMELPHCNAAYVLRGDMVLHKNLSVLSLCKDFAEVVATARYYFPRLAEVWKNHIGRWEIIIAGVQDEPEMFYFASWEDELRQIEDDAWIGGPETEVRTMLECGFQRPDNMRDFDPVTHGIPLMEAFRRTEEQGQHVVGGFVAHTEIARDRVETRVIHEWPDRIGERIAP